MKKKMLVFLIVMGLAAGTVSAQFGGIVYDPTNYSNALLRYAQLQQQLIQLKNSYTQLVSQYNLAVQMAKNIQNMPARYRAVFCQMAKWHCSRYVRQHQWMDDRHQFRDCQWRLPAGDHPTPPLQPGPSLRHEC